MSAIKDVLVGLTRNPNIKTDTRAVQYNTIDGHPHRSNHILFVCTKQKHRHSLTQMHRECNMSVSTYGTHKLTPNQAKQKNKKLFICSENHCTQNQRFHTDWIRYVWLMLTRLFPLHHTCTWFLFMIRSLPCYWSLHGGLHFTLWEEGKAILYYINQLFFFLFSFQPRLMSPLSLSVLSTQFVQSFKNVLDM